MANYFLNANGTIEKQKKKKGNNYILKDDGTLEKVSLPTTSQSSNNKNKLKKLEKKYVNSNKKVKEDTQKIGNYLNERGQNVDINKPFIANVISNEAINKSRNELSGRVTLEDVVQTHHKILNGEEDISTTNNQKDIIKDRIIYNNLEQNKGNLANVDNNKIISNRDDVQNKKSTDILKLRENLKNSRNERALAQYNYNKALVNSEDVTLADKTINIIGIFKYININIVPNSLTTPPQ